MRLFKSIGSQSLKLYLAVSLVACFVPTSILAQGGKNDTTFNIVDNVAAQGFNKSITTSTIQLDNKILIAGEFTGYNGRTANKLMRLTVDGKQDESFNAESGVDGLIKTIAVQPDGKIIIAGEFSTFDGVSVNRIVRLTENGSIDPFFNSGVGANSTISKIIIQPDGKILLAGAFTTYDTTHVNGLVRLTSNGSMDQTFVPETNSLSHIYQIGLQPDGKIVIAGKAASLNGGMANFIEIIRLNYTGAKDHSLKSCFINVGDAHAQINSICIENTGNILLAGAINDMGNMIRYRGLILRVSSEGDILDQKNTFWINELAILTDGKIIAAGFEYLKLMTIKRCVVRLNEDLTVDPTFNYQDKKNYSTPYVSQFITLSAQLDGKLIIGGNFSEVNGFVTNNIVRLTTNGTVDQLFNQHTGANGTIFVTAVQSNGYIILGGEFSRYNYRSATNITRITKDGELDLSFNTGIGTNGNVYALAIQANGKIIVGGDFTSYNGNKCSNIVRLNADGSFDPSFRYVTANGAVRKIDIDCEGKVLLGGDFSLINGISKIALARINQRGLLDKRFSPRMDYTSCVYDIRTTYRGKIYIAVNYKNTPELSLYSKVICLKPDGTADGNFTFSTELFNQINAISITRCGKIIAAGEGYYTDPRFDEVKGLVIQYDSEGNADETFNYKGLEPYLNKSVRTITVLNNNQLIIAGDFSAYESPDRSHIYILNKDGSIDMSFRGSSNNSIYASALVDDNKLIIAGSFSEYTSVVRNGVARITLQTLLRLQSYTFVKEESPITESVLLYPNPAVSDLTVSNLIRGSAFVIFNSTGKEMYNGVAASEKSIIPLGDYSNGIYFLTTQINGRKTTSKFIVNK